MKMLRGVVNHEPRNGAPDEHQKIQMLGHHCWRSFAFGICCETDVFLPQFDKLTHPYSTKPEGPVEEELDLHRLVPTIDR